MSNITFDLIMAGANIGFILVFPCALTYIINGGAAACALLTVLVLWGHP